MEDRDNVAKDLLEIVRDSRFDVTDPDGGTDEDKLMQKLCSYVSRRDSKVWNHAYQLGKEAGDGNRKGKAHKQPA